MIGISHEIYFKISRTYCSTIFWIRKFKKLKYEKSLKISWLIIYISQDFKKSLNIWKNHSSKINSLFPTLHKFLLIQTIKYRKVASSRPVYSSIFEQFWGATNWDVLLTEGYYIEGLLFNILLLTKAFRIVSR